MKGIRLDVIPVCQSYNIPHFCEKREVVRRDMECLGVGLCHVEGISQISEESVTDPTKPRLDVRVRVPLSVQEVAGSDLD